MLLQPSCACGGSTTSEAFAASRQGLLSRGRAALRQLRAAGGRAQPSRTASCRCSGSLEGSGNSQQTPHSVEELLRKQVCASAQHMHVAPSTPQAAWPVPPTKCVCKPQPCAQPLCHDPSQVHVQRYPNISIGCLPVCRCSRRQRWTARCLSYGWCRTPSLKRAWQTSPGMDPHM